MNLSVGRGHNRLWSIQVSTQCVIIGVTCHQIPRESTHAYTFTIPCILKRLLQHPWQLRRCRRHLIVVTASVEHVQVGGLKALSAVILRGNGRGQSQHGRTPAMSIIKTVDEMDMARPGTASTAPNTTKHTFSHGSIGTSFFM